MLIACSTNSKDRVKTVALASCICWQGSSVSFCFSSNCFCSTTKVATEKICCTVRLTICQYSRHEFGFWFVFVFIRLEIMEYNHGHHMWNIEKIPSIFRSSNVLLAMIVGGTASTPLVKSLSVINVEPISTMHPSLLPSKTLSRNIIA